MSVIYYSPSELTKLNSNKEYCEIFKLFGQNALILDRTNTIPSPVKTTNLFPIPDYSLLESFDKGFAEICIQRASEILSLNKPIILLYSGGIDSTVVLLAFDFLLKGKSKDQITIATSPLAIKENTWAWHDLILPSYKITSILDVMNNIDLEKNRYVHAENADQLFGSDKIFRDGSDINQPFSKDTLATFISSKLKNPDLFVELFMSLSEKAPKKITLFRDFLWWVNFSCKWQGVALRTLAASGTLHLNKEYPLTYLDAFDPFFNTTDFQLFALGNNIKRFGDQPSKTNYKLESRIFIDSMVDWTEYTKNKIKVGSLWNVTILTNTSLNAIKLSGNKIYSSPISDIDCQPWNNDSR